MPGVKPRIRFSGDTLLLVDLGDAIDAEVNERVMRVAEHVAAAALPGVRDVVPAYCAVGVHFDPLRTDMDAVERAIREGVGQAPGGVAPAQPVVEIPVCYGGARGPDLDQVAAWSGLTPEEVVRRHSGRTYRVYMLGFVPGFAYMAHVEPAIAMPRHRVPRERVPAGSVGIAGEQTGIYPVATPGGWQVIGQCPLRMFAPDRSPATRCVAGDTVRFVRISGAEFDELALSPDGIGSGW